MASDFESEQGGANGGEPCDFAGSGAGNATDEGGRPDSGLIQNPRARPIADLSARIAEAAAVGDLALARMLGRALAELLGEPPQGEAAEIVDLNAQRKERG